MPKPVVTNARVCGMFARCMTISPRFVPPQSKSYFSDYQPGKGLTGNGLSDFRHLFHTDFRWHHQTRWRPFGTWGVVRRLSGYLDRAQGRSSLVITARKLCLLSTNQIACILEGFLRFLFPFLPRYLLPLAHRLFFFTGRLGTKHKPAFTSLCAIFSPHRNKNKGLMFWRWLLKLHYRDETEAMVTF